MKASILGKFKFMNHLKVEQNHYQNKLLSDQVADGSDKPSPSYFKRRRAKGGLSVGRLDKRPIAIIRPKTDGDGDAAKLKGLLSLAHSISGPTVTAYLAKILLTAILIFVGAEMRSL